MILLSNTVTASRHGEISKGGTQEGVPYWLLIYAFPTSNVGMNSGKRELPYRVPRSLGTINSHDPERGALWLVASSALLLFTRFAQGGGGGRFAPG
jgi:hypothetical protein